MRRDLGRSRRLQLDDHLAICSGCRQPAMDLMGPLDRETIVDLDSCAIVADPDHTVCWLLLWVHFMRQFDERRSGINPDYPSYRPATTRKSPCE